jgi:hypothetical protein
MMDCISINRKFQPANHGRYVHTTPNSAKEELRDKKIYRTMKRDAMAIPGKFISPGLPGPICNEGGEFFSGTSSHPPGAGIFAGSSGDPRVVHVKDTKKEPGNHSPGNGPILDDS